MPRIFFTYVWGAPGEPSWPLTFASKGSRSHAKRALSEGDLVFTVGTKGDPTPATEQGRVLGAFMVSDLEVNTTDYDLPAWRGSTQFDGVRRFPFALHPIAVSVIATEDNIFSELVGPLTGAHHLKAQSHIVELEGDAAAALLRLPRRQVAPAVPRTAFGQGRVLQKNSRLAPMHQGQYVAEFATHELWFVYTLVLRDARKRAVAVKVGYASDPAARLAAYSAGMATEVTGLQWSMDVQQPVASEEVARRAEQAVLGRFAKHKLGSNGEILRDVEPSLVAAAIGTELRGVSPHI